MSESTFYAIMGIGVTIVGILLFLHKLMNLEKPDNKFEQSFSIQLWIASVFMMIIGKIMFFKNI